jgi:phage/plasmid-like protein (TIGR03299 family)
MAHDLEQRDGKVTFALRGAPAWHNLAQTTFTEDQHVTTSEMLDGALLSKWDVRLEESVLPEGYTTDKPSFMVVRNNPFNPEENNVLGIVGERYRTYQNEQLFAFGDNILDGGGYWESAGSIKGGRVVFGSLKLDREIILDPNGVNDKTDTYLLVVTSHDGSSSIQAMTTPVRVVCQNTLNAAIAGQKQSFKIRHTATADDRALAAREALGLANHYLTAFDLQAQELFAQAVSDKTFEQIIQAVYPEPDSDAGKASLTKYETKIDLIKDLYYLSPTQEGIRGTAWGVYNAMTERVDYYRDGRKVKGAKGDASKNLSAAASGFDTQANSEKNRILSAVKELAGV